MDFGLGLVLSFTDNATAGINNAVNSLGHLTDVAEGASNSLNSMASLPLHLWGLLSSPPLVRLSVK